MCVVGDDKRCNDVGEYAWYNAGKNHYQQPDDTQEHGVDVKEFSKSAANTGKYFVSIAFV